MVEKKLDWQDLFPCVNGLDTHYMYRDLVDVMEQVGDKVDTILAKVGTKCDVYLVDCLLIKLRIAKN